MARQVLPIVGAIVGAYFGGPQGAQIGFAIGSLVGNAVDPLKVAGPRLGEGSGQTSAEGVYRPVVLGTGAVGGNIIHRGPQVIRTQRQQAGKGGGPITITERRYRTFAIRICEGPIAGITRIWMDEKLVYDTRPESPIPAETLDFSQRFRLYTGTEDQLPDPDLEAYMGVGNVNSYRGTAYFVFPNFDLTDYSDRIPLFRTEVVGTGIASPGTAVLAARSSDPDSPFTALALPSPDGLDWAANWEAQTNFRNTHLFATSERFISYNNGSVPSWREPGDAGWTVGTGVAVSGTGSAKLAAMDATQQVILIANGLGNRPLRSMDGGKTWEHVANVHSSDAMAFFGARFLSFYLGNLYASDTIGDNFTFLASTGMSSAVSLCRWSGISGVMFGASTASIPRLPAMVESANGLLFTAVPLPAFPPGASAVTAVCSGWFDGDSQETWVCMTDAGDIAYRDPADSLWKLSPDTMECTAYDITFNGRVFIAIGGRGSTGDDGFIKTSANGRDWVTRKTQGIDFDENWWQVSALVISAGTVVAERIPLSSIVQWVHNRIGSPSSSYNVSELTDLVDGIVLADGYTAADAIRTLMPIYMFDACEADIGSGYRINYIKRGKPVVATLTIDDLVDDPEEAVREDALERPRVLHLHFQNPKIGYAAGKASPRRNSPDERVVGEISTSVPVVFSDVDEAWQRADVLLRVAWAEVGGNQELTLSDNWLKLTPTDCVGLVLRGQVRRLRMETQEITGGSIKTEWRVDRQSAYTSNITGIPLPDPEPPPPSIVGDTINVIGDWPALTDNHDRLLYYSAATGLSPAWFGATIQRSTDGGANYQNVADHNQNTIMGVLLNDITSASPHYTDTTNVLRVSIYRDDVIDSLTDQEFLSEGGAFALEWQDSGVSRWEICQYRDAVQVADSEWELSHLLRGRLNTESAAHFEGARFVMLDGVVTVDAVTALIDSELTHRAVSYGSSPESAIPQTAEYTALSQTEWPVAHLFLTRDGDEIQATCVPRHRFGTEDRPVRSINWTGYRWVATDGSNTATSDTLTESYVFDATGWSSPITVSVSQLNRFTGAGPTVSESIA